MDRSLIDDALKLSPGERLRLIEHLWMSLDRPDADIDRAWIEEAERRMEEIRQGNAKLVLGEDVLGR